jgi:cyanate permease
VLVAVKHSGIKVAQSAAGLVLAPAAAVVGWRPAFAVPAALSAVGAAWVPRFIGRLETPAEDSQSSSAPLPGSMWWLMAYSVLMGLSQSALATYTAIYAFEAVSFDAATAGLLTGMLGLTGVAARLGWGVWAHALKGVRPLQAMALGSVPATAALIAAQTVGAPLLWVAVIVLGITSSIWNLCVTIVVFRLVPSALTGQATGRVYLGFAAGMMVGPMIFGFAVDASGHYDAAWGSLMIWQLLAALMTLPLLRAERRRSA